MLLSSGLPPFGWWPLALLGAAVVVGVVEGLALPGRMAVGAAAGAGFLGPGLWWMTEFHVAGYALAVAVAATLFGLGVALAPAGAGLGLGLPAALVGTEALRGAWPFGGVPVATLAQTQIGGPLATASRLGGGLLVAGLVGAAGVALAAAGRRRLGPTATAAALVASVVLASAVAPQGRRVADLDVAAVQAGGPRGLRAVENPGARGAEGAIEASAGLGAVDLVVWPENALTVDGALADSAVGRRVAALVRELDATLVAGVVERSGDRFHNRAVAWGPDGRILGSYEKRRRVPFGEYIPWRSLVARVADVRFVPRDAFVGSGPGLLATPAGDLGVAVSYEVFFAERARAAVRAGGEVLLVPTNASSYPSTQMPALELGAARLRAIETGRAVVQAAPTGFSAVIDADGTLQHQSDLGEPAVVAARVERRQGTTVYVRSGDAPVLAAAGVALGAAWLLERRRRPPPRARRAG